VWLGVVNGPPGTAGEPGPGRPPGPPLPTGGHGLVGMRERAASLGGALTARPTPEGGFSVTAHLPEKAGERT
ncbi:MAG TPA: hypothetical protein VIL71_08125, partial [Spirillospora sp.]